MAKAAQPTVTLKHLAAGLAADHEMAKKHSETILNDFVGMIVKHLKKGDRIRIGGLGILQVRKRAARMGRNPATGEPIKIKASKKVAFRAAKELKEAIRSQREPFGHPGASGRTASGPVRRDFVCLAARLNASRQDRPSAPRREFFACVEETVQQKR